MAERTAHLLAGLCLLSLLLIGQVQAHDLGVARVILTPLGDDRVLLEAKLPAKLKPSAPMVPNGCSIRDQGQRVNGLTRLATWRIECPDGLLLAEDSVVVLDWQRDSAMVVVKEGDTREGARLIGVHAGVIRLKLADLIGGKTGAMSIASRYIALGTEHILLGIDHLAFVLLLCLLARGWKLVKLVTAFTVGHSATLVLATFGWVHLPVPPVEATIALSIVFLARETLLPEHRRRHGYWLVVGFGMLHGFGFASALAELGVDSSHLLLSLLSFNLGVELGQLLFVAFVRALSEIPRDIGGPNIARLTNATAFGVGSLAVFWTLERVATFSPRVF